MNNSRDKRLNLCESKFYSVSVESAYGRWGITQLGELSPLAFCWILEVTTKRGVKEERIHEDLYTQLQEYYLR